jgi:hypothetical protein
MYVEYIKLSVLNCINCIKLKMLHLKKDSEWKDDNDDESCLIRIVQPNCYTDTKADLVITVLDCILYIKPN